MQARVRVVGLRTPSRSRAVAVAEREVRSSRAGGILGGISHVPTNVPHGEAWQEEGEQSRAW